MVEASDRFVIAMSRFRRQKYDECVDLCTDFLKHNARDQVCLLLAPPL